MARWKHVMRRIRKPFEIGGFLLLKWTVPLLPRRAVTGVARLAGRLMWLLPTREKKYGLINLDAVFGEIRTADEKRRILISSFSTFTQTMLDLMWFSRNPEKRIPEYVDFDASFDPFFTGNAQVCITAHFGNWETMGAAAALRGVNLASIAATLKNKQVDRLLCGMREQTGQIIIPQRGAMRTLIARLRKDEKVAFVLDQNTDLDEGGITVNFLDLPMSVSAAPASLAYRTGTEIFFGLCKPQKSGRYLLYSPGTLQPPDFNRQQDAAREVRELTQKIQDRISEEIRAHPEYWLWSYKHWRRRSGETDPPGYPDYDRKV